ncbi:hypothetical protein CY34DRAFT_799675 [Suillus luteus UH-Slu-Lm8-n1]|uniref:Unplaced genomic scaffold CY34scaffold_19, whole genome shotgun sequence n=1 Tax=Suillus luteus UH-Slu-Lm8-n1 TaxID=930992 RepID=A0A0D0AA68_9AGAM|nr:hypothetical protein CY34DRAFT_799675 [Suillus luteus UH-Slu-Lm8-n1]
METLYIVCGLTALVALIALCFSLIDDSPPPQPPFSGVCSPSDSPYVPIPSQQGSYHQLRHPQLPPLRSAVQSLSKYSTLQAPSSSQPSPYQPHRLPSAQYPPSATTHLLSRDDSVPKLVCYTPQQPSRPIARAPPVPAVPIVIDSPDRPTARAPQVPVVPAATVPYERPVARVPQIAVAPAAIVPYERSAARVPQIAVVPTAIDPYKRPAARVPQIVVVPTAIDPGRPAARAPEVPVARVVIDPHEDPKSLRLKATQEGDRMGKCFKERNEARARNEHQRAKELTQRGEVHKANMTLLDKEASAKIFQENNQKRRNEVDLHGLYVAEARSYFDISLQGARDREESSLRVIVGKTH